MTERENALHIINHTGKQQWVPHFLTCCDMVLPTDVIAERPVFGTSGYDWFGCHWTFDAATNGFVQTPSVPFPVSDVTKWREQVKFPDLEAIDWETRVAPSIAKLNRTEKLTKIMIESGVFERAHALLGFENAFIAIYDEPETFNELMDAIADFKVALMAKVAKYYKADIVMNMDDYATQTGLLMSPDMFRTHVKPFASRVGKAIIDNGMIYEHHSCGKVDALVGDIIDMGAKLLNPVMPRNDFDMLQEKYGKVLAFDGGLNNQMVIDYPGATEEDIQAEVRRAIDQYAPYRNHIVGAYGCSFEREGLVMEETIKYSGIIKDNLNRQDSWLKL